MPIEILTVCKYIILAVIIISFLQFWISLIPPKFHSTIKPDEFGIPYEQVSFNTADGVTIAGWWIPGKGNMTLIVGHGYPFDKGNIFQATVWLHPEFNLFYYDHRSFGESKGIISTAGAREAKDVEAAINFVKKKQPGKIGLYGFSMSGAAMLLSSKTSVSAIVVDSTYATLDAMIHRTYALFGPLRWPFVWITKLYSIIFLGISADNVSPAKELAKAKIPVLIIHGSKDSQIPVENAYNLYEQSNKKKVELWIIEGADHGESIAVAKEKYKKRIIKFFNENQ